MNLCMYVGQTFSNVKLGKECHSKWILYHPCLSISHPTTRLELNIEEIRSLSFLLNEKILGGVSGKISF